jgi:hypothetical protein
MRSLVRRCDCCSSDPARVERGRLKYSDLSPLLVLDAQNECGSDWRLVREEYRGFGSGQGLPYVWPNIVLMYCLDPRLQIIGERVQQCFSFIAVMYQSSCQCPAAGRSDPVGFDGT